MTTKRLPSRQERKAEFKRRGIPFQPLYGGTSMRAPLNVVLGRIEHLNLTMRRANQPSPSANGETTSSNAASHGTDPPATESEAAT